MYGSRGQYERGYRADAREDLSGAHFLTPTRQ
jgi:hypothetical protein